jgi:hypothetical protein
MFLIVFQAVDAVYFNGGNKDGQYMVAATARRHNNTQVIDKLYHTCAPRNNNISGDRHRLHR